MFFIKELKDNLKMETSKEETWHKSRKARTAWTYDAVRKTLQTKEFGMTLAEEWTIHSRGMNNIR